MPTPASLLRHAVMSGVLALTGVAVAQTAPAPNPPPGLKDADGRTLRRAPTGHLTNYYEDKVPPYTLPDPLVLAAGGSVRDADTWFKQRRPELLKL